MVEIADEFAKVLRGNPGIVGLGRRRGRLCGTRELPCRDLVFAKQAAQATMLL